MAYIPPSELMSLEMISFQKDPEIFFNITNCLKKIRESKHKFSNKNTKTDQKVINDSGLIKYLSERMNLSIVSTVRSDIGVNAYMIPPDLDKNHPLIDSMRRQYYSNKDVKKRIKEAKSTIKGSVDLSKVRVDGIYSEIPILICMSTQILMDSLFSIEEAASIFCHELGHAFTYFIYLGRSATISPIMGDILDEYKETKTYEHRVEFLKVVKESLNLTNMEPDALAKVTKGETIQTLVVTDMIQKTNSMTNTPWYDLRTFEILADQFVVRIGGGKYLGAALDKLFRFFDSSAYQTQVRYIATQVFVGMIGILIAPIALLVMALSTPYQIYDDPIKRIERLSSDLKNALKNINNDKLFNDRILKEIAELEKLTKGLKDRDDVITWVWKNMMPGTRRQVKKAELIQELEDLSNNPLYLASAKMRSF